MSSIGIHSVVAIMQVDEEMKREQGNELTERERRGSWLLPCPYQVPHRGPKAEHAG